MKFPFVSRARYDQAERIISIHEETIARLRAERDEQQARADRALDYLALNVGYAPVSTPSRIAMSKQEQQAQQDAQAVAAMANVDADLALDTEMDAQLRAIERGVN